MCEWALNVNSDTQNLVLKGIKAKCVGFKRPIKIFNEFKNAIKQICLM